MVWLGKEIDIEKATLMVIRYFESIHGNIGLLSFRIENVYPNSKEHVWIVDCTFFPSLGSKERVYYVVRVDIKNGSIISAKKREKNNNE